MFDSRVTDQYGANKATPRVLADDRDPWDRQPRESGLSYKRFLIYRSIPREDRTYQAVADIVGVSKAAVSMVASRNNWRIRAEAWDRVEDDMLRRKQMKEIEDMRARHARIALTAQSKAIERLNVTRLRMSVSEATRLLQVGVQMERDARGVASEYAVEVSQVEPADDVTADSVAATLRDPQRLAAFHRWMMELDGNANPFDSEDDDAPDGDEDDGG